jgi:hypothetical protein
MPGYELRICGPASEPAFFEVYGQRIKESNNISYEGFVMVGSDKFHDLCSSCSYVILNAASEACATSVVTCQRAGLVPIVTPECGIDVNGFGFLMNGKDNRIDDIIQVAETANMLSKEDYRNRVYNSLISSQKYTQASFTRLFSQAILEIMRGRM